MFIVTKPSGIYPERQCVLGEGPTKAQALENAYGPKPWTPYLRRSASLADVREVTEDELDALKRV